MWTYLLMLIAMMFIRDAKHAIMQKAPTKTQRPLRFSNHISPSKIPGNKQDKMKKIHVKIETLRWQKRKRAPFLSNHFSPPRVPAKKFKKRKKRRKTKRLKWSTHIDIWEPSQQQSMFLLQKHQQKQKQKRRKRKGWKYTLTEMNKWEPPFLLQTPRNTHKQLCAIVWAHCTRPQKSVVAFSSQTKKDQSCSHARKKNPWRSAFLFESDVHWF